MLLSSQEQVLEADQPACAGLRKGAGPLAWLHSGLEHAPSSTLAHVPALFALPSPSCVHRDISLRPIPEYTYNHPPSSTFTPSTHTCMPFTSLCSSFPKIHLHPDTLSLPLHLSPDTCKHLVPASALPLAHRSVTHLPQRWTADEVLSLPATGGNPACETCVKKWWSEETFVRGSEWVEGKAWSEQKSTNDIVKLEHWVPSMGKRTPSSQSTRQMHVFYANIQLMYAREQEVYKYWK